jgi:hypothetical protein
MIDVYLIESGLEMRLGCSGLAFFQIPAFCGFVHTMSRPIPLREREGDRLVGLGRGQPSNSNS